MTAPPLPGRVFDRELPDGSNTYVDLATGEIKTYSPSQVRARRLAARQAAHEAAKAAQREQSARAAVRGADACRAALPPKPPPVGLQRSPVLRPLVDPLPWAEGSR